METTWLAPSTEGYDRSLGTERHGLGGRRWRCIGGMNVFKRDMHAVCGQYKSDLGVAVLGKYHRQTPWTLVTKGTMAHDCSIELIDKPPYSPDRHHWISICCLTWRSTWLEHIIISPLAVPFWILQMDTLTHRLCKTRPSSKQVSWYCGDAVKRLWSGGVTKLWLNWKIAGEKCPHDTSFI